MVVSQNTIYVGEKGGFMVNIPKKKSGKASKCPPLEDFAKLYAVYTSRKIGIILGVSASTVRTWARKYRLKEENGDGK